MPFSVAWLVGVNKRNCTEPAEDDVLFCSELSEDTIIKDMALYGFIMHLAYKELCVKLMYVFHPSRASLPPTFNNCILSR